MPALRRPPHLSDPVSRAARRRPVDIPEALLKWRIVGACHRAGNALRIRIRQGPSAGLYSVTATDAPRLVVDSDPVTLWQLGDGLAPTAAGTADWSENGTMMRIEITRTASRYLVPGNELVRRYLSEDHRDVNVVVPPGVPV